MTPRSSAVRLYSVTTPDTTEEYVSRINSYISCKTGILDWMTSLSKLRLFMGSQLEVDSEYCANETQCWVVDRNGSLLLIPIIDG